MDEVVVYRKYGVTDNNLIVRARKLDRSNRTSSESIAVAMIACKTKDINGVENYQKQLERQI